MKQNINGILERLDALSKVAERLEHIDHLNHIEGANLDDPELRTAIRCVYRKIANEMRKLPRHYRI